VHDSAISSAAFKSQLDWAARVSHHAYTNLTGPDYGIRWLESYELSDSPPGDFTTHVEDDQTERIVTDHQRLFSAMG